MAFALLAVILFAALLVQITKGRHQSRIEKAALCFFSFLYAALCYSIARLPESPLDVYVLTAVALMLGIVVFWGDFLIGWWRSRRAVQVHLKELKRGQGPLQQIIWACELLSRSKQGALIVLERRDSLEPWCEKGIPVQAVLTKELLFSIFTPPGDLHDGAVLVRGGHILASGVILPLTQSSTFRKDLGTRHRAALGMTEVSDALCLVVSEETGSVSIAEGGILYYHLPLDQLPRYLADGIRFRLKKTGAAPLKPRLFKKRPQTVSVPA